MSEYYEVVLSSEEKELLHSALISRIHDNSIPPIIRKHSDALCRKLDELLSTEQWAEIMDGERVHQIELE